jgi:RNA-directed DNA polymerase
MTSNVEEVPMGVQITWDNVDWQYATKHVNKLQVRIAKAVKSEKHHLVKRLQYLIKNSVLAKLLAVRRITTNKGKRTPGIDGVIWKTPKQKLKAAHSLRSKKYNARPLKRTYIEKRGKQKKRPLGIPTMYDRATWILEGDIKGCFDHINHEWLYNNIPMDKKVLKEFLASGYVYRNKLFPTEAGTPQGGIASPILANMALDGMERAIKARYWSSNTGRIYKGNNKHKVNLIQYADDFIVTADSK